MVFGTGDRITVLHMMDAVHVRCMSDARPISVTVVYSLCGLGGESVYKTQFVVPLPPWFSRTVSCSLHHGDTRPSVFPTPARDAAPRFCELPSLGPQILAFQSPKTPEMWPSVLLDSIFRSEYNSVRKASSYGPKS